MNLIADILLVAGALGAAIYCMVLARRLKQFNGLEKGMGGAIAVLSVQVDEMTKALEAAQVAAKASSSKLEALNGRAEHAAARLELMLAALHDLPSEPHKEQLSKRRVIRNRPAAQPATISEAVG